MGKDRENPQIQPPLFNLQNFNVPQHQDDKTREFKNLEKIFKAPSNKRGRLSGEDRKLQLLDQEQD